MPIAISLVGAVVLRAAIVRGDVTIASVEVDAAGAPSVISLGRGHTGPGVGSSGRRLARNGGGIVHDALARHDAVQRRVGLWAQHLHIAYDRSSF